MQHHASMQTKQGNPSKEGQGRSLWGNVTNPLHRCGCYARHRQTCNVVHVWERRILPWPSCPCRVQIARGTESLFPAPFGGLVALTRLPNTPEATAAWQASASARLGFNITFHDDGLSASANEVRACVFASESSHGAAVGRAPTTQFCSGRHSLAR